MQQSGENNLIALFSSLQTILHPDIFVFITLTTSTQLPPPFLFIQMSFREIEGITIITTRESAVANGLDYTFPCRMITLNVHSSLEAIGFMAVITTKLADKNISTNPVSGFYHDHLFVPLGREEEALEALKNLSSEG